MKKYDLNFFNDMNKFIVKDDLRLYSKLADKVWYAEDDELEKMLFNKREAVTLANRAIYYQLEVSKGSGVYPADMLQSARKKVDVKHFYMFENGENISLDNIQKVTDTIIRCGGDAGSIQFNLRKEFGK